MDPPLANSETAARRQALSQKNHIPISEQYEREKLDLAKAILAGETKATEENLEFYRNWATKYLAWWEKHGKGVVEPSGQRRLID